MKDIIKEDRETSRLQSIDGAARQAPNDRAGALPEFAPFMLRCLTYTEALQSMRNTGCAVRRQHWCSPVVVYEGTRLILDNEDRRDPWRPTREDREARDWEMVALTPSPATACSGDADAGEGRG